ncbi:hypothetical protein EI94DRAFT_1712798, partial [Lactarius quietus]
MGSAQRLLVVLVTTPATQGGERGVEIIELYRTAQPCRGDTRARNRTRRTSECAVHGACPARYSPALRTPVRCASSRYSVCGMRAVFSRPTRPKGHLVLRVADYHAGRVARGHDLFPEASRRVSRVDDAMEPDRRRSRGRIGQTERNSGAACGAVLLADEGSVGPDGRAVAMTNGRPAWRCFERSVPQPWSIQVGNGLSVASVLCEDSILFFQL